jgi:hypothetical protein
MTTRVVENRDLALKIGYAATDWNYPITFEEHVSRAKKWDVRLIERDGNPIGAIFEKDGEVHCSILPEWRRRWLTKGLLRQIVGGPAFHTRVDDGHDYMYGILERLGMTRGPDGVVRKVS